MNERLDKNTLKNLYGRISPFELKDKLISLANLNKDKFKGTLLDYKQISKASKYNKKVKSNNDLIK